MADVKKLAPIVAQWEGGYGCFAEDTGCWNSKKELVGTKYGISAGAYEQYFGKCPTVEDMKNLTTDDFVIVLQKFWDKWRASEINNQSIANLVVDWHYNSGSWGITIPQKVLKVTADGIVGSKTIAAVNSADQEKLFNDLKQARIDFFNEITKRNPDYKKFYKGWMNRVNSFTYAA